MRTTNYQCTIVGSNRSYHTQAKSNFARKTKYRIFYGFYHGRKLREYTNKKRTIQQGFFRWFSWVVWYYKKAQWIRIFIVKNISYKVIEISKTMRIYILLLRRSLYSHTHRRATIVSMSSRYIKEVTVSDYPLSHLSSPLKHHRSSRPTP